MAASSLSSSKSNVRKIIATTRRKKLAVQAAAAAKSKATKRRKLAAKNPKKRKITKTTATCSCLPDELWECIFKCFNCDLFTFKSLSIVSKQFLSITNGLRISIRITDKTIPYLSQLFNRFPNVTSVDLSRLSQERDLGAILTEISTFSLDLRALSCNCIAANGLLALSKTMKNLSSFTYTPLFPFSRRMGSIKKNDILFITESFPLLERIILTYPSVYSRQFHKLIASVTD